MVDEWYDSSRLLRAALISFKAVVPSHLDPYSDMIKRYSSHYPGAWHHVLEADNRARLEHVERLCRRGVEEASTALAAGGHHDFDQSKPWDWVWKQL
eukprot:3585297-Amphidinium_carterae.1